MIIHNLKLESDVKDVVHTDISVGDSIEKYRNPFEVKNLSNGLYYYRKLLIPVYSESDGSEVDEYLWFDTETNKVVYYDVDSMIFKEFDPEKDIDDIYEIVREKTPKDCFHFDDFSFSIYQLVRCYVLAERDRINQYLKNGCMACKNSFDLSNKSDILLAAINVITALIEKEEYFEAQRILDSLMSCGKLCEDSMNDDLNNCGCGRT